MKVFNFFAHVFSIFAFLTIGSLLLIVASHILSVDDAIFKIRELYASPWRSVQSGFIGIVFISVGLSFARMLVKKGRESDVVITQGDMGPVVVSVSAMEDAAKKTIKKFHLVRSWKLKTLIKSKDVEMRLRLNLWAGGNVPELLSEIQQEVGGRIQKMLGSDCKVEISCDVQRVEDHEPQYSEEARRQSVSAV